MEEEHEVFIKSSVRGYQVYFVDASVVIGEVLTCERDHDNVHDKYAIAVKYEDQTLVGHVPKELSKIFSRFYGTTGRLRQNVLELGEGKGLQIPMDCNLKEIAAAERHSAGNLHSATNLFPVFTMGAHLDKN